MKTLPRLDPKEQRVAGTTAETIRLAVRQGKVPLLALRRREPRQRQPGTRSRCAGPGCRTLLRVGQGATCSDRCELLVLARSLADLRRLFHLTVSVDGGEEGSH